MAVGTDGRHLGRVFLQRGVDHVAQLTKRIDGVLGNDFMKRFVVTIDHRRGRVTFA